MDELKIMWTHTAVKQRNYVFEYWNKRNKNRNYSKKLNLEIRKNTDLLKKQPLIGRMIEFKNYRILFMHHYSIVYRLMDKNVIITAFWDNRQDPKKLIDFIKNQIE